MNSSHFDPAFATAAETADAIRTGVISARELLQIIFERIDRHNPALNAIVWQDRDEGMRRAKDADERRVRGSSFRALDGVPITIKESFAYRGSPNTWGIPALKNALSPRTAVAVERLESAGAIVVGKTNVPVMLGDWQSDNPIYGTTSNPWDLARTPGGSTGGGAAAVAAGLGSLTIGSDLSGSIRIPAHMCGVYGHKPSLGLVSMAGFQPGPWDGQPGYLMDLAVAGPLARSARDLGLALELLGGPNGDEATAWTWRVPSPRHTRLADYRVGYILDDAFCHVASDVSAVYETALSALSTCGATLAPGWPAGVDSHSHLNAFQYLLFALVMADADESERERARKRLGQDPNDVMATATAGPHSRWLHETQRRLAYRAVWQQYFDNHDVFLLPTTFTAAFPHDHSRPLENRVIGTAEGRRSYVRDLPYWISFATLAGIPATAAPVGCTASGLPVGIQILAPMWEDATSIEFAALLADVVGEFTPPPAFHS